VRSELFKQESMAQPPTAPGMSLQHSKCVKYVVNGEVLARQGAMIAYRGQIQFEVKSQGAGNFIRRAVTGEGLPLMACRGQGEIWFAQGANDCFIIDVEPGDALSINGRNVLVFDPSPAVPDPAGAGRGHVRRRPVQLGVHRIGPARHHLRRAADRHPGGAEPARLRRHRRGDRLVVEPAVEHPEVAEPGLDAARRLRRGVPVGAERAGLRDRAAQRGQGRSAAAAEGRRPASAASGG
jgi:hypothetical protein